MADKIWADGMRFDLPDAKTIEKAPWIKGKISIRVDDFIKFIQTYKNTKGFVNIDIKKSDKSGNYYLELNTWTKEKAEQQKLIDAETKTAFDSPW